MNFSKPKRKVGIKQTEPEKAIGGAMLFSSLVGPEKSIIVREKTVGRDMLLYESKEPCSTLVSEQRGKRGHYTYWTDDNPWQCSSLCIKRDIWLQVHVIIKEHDCETDKTSGERLLFELQNRFLK